jgi:hypothetical protein
MKLSTYPSPPQSQTGEAILLVKADIFVGGEHSRGVFLKDSVNLLGFSWQAELFQELAQALITCGGSEKVGGEFHERKQACQLVLLPHRE